MTNRPQLLLLQLPIPQTVPLAPTGNVPLAAGCLAVAARTQGLDEQLHIEVVPPAITDAYGDALLADHVAQREPRFVGLSLYLWNSHRSLHLARMIKERSPRTTIIVGGPEVGPDNPFVLEQTGYDLAVTGEAEESFVALMRALLEGRDPRGLANVAVRGPLGLGPFGGACGAGFELTRYASPYLDGTLPVEPLRSTYVETVRGCRSHCTFCFYPRSSSVLRVLDVQRSLALVQRLRELGAREVVFLDPTFNHRPELEELLEGLGEINRDGALSFFAEVRSEGLTPAHGDLLAKAGFTKVEIGLQSVSKKTLKITKRGGNPEKVAAAARMLRERGIGVIVDLIVGLPGDTVDDIRRGMDFLHEHELADDAQVFALALLPGTEMRTHAERDGIEFDPAPPYRVRHTPLLSADDIQGVLDWAEDRLERSLDDDVRPLLARDLKGPAPSCFTFDVDAQQSPRALDVPGAQHASLWLCGHDLWGARHALGEAVEARLRVDPHAMLDVVLMPRREMPLNVVAHLRAVLDRAPHSYASRVLAHRGIDAQRRISAVLPRDVRFDNDYVQALSDEVPVFMELSAQEAAARVVELADRGLGVHVVGDDIDDASWNRLAAEAPPELVTFAKGELERRWVLDVLSYREIR